MNCLQEFLMRAAKELGIKINVGYVVMLSDGRSLVSQALVRDLGGPKGTLIFCCPDRITDDIRGDLVAQGFGISTFSEPLSGEIFDIASYSEMFSDWGWVGDEDEKPSWMS